MNSRNPSVELLKRASQPMILTIRAHKRYAIRQAVGLRSAPDGCSSSGLMIELSTEGCRISGLVACALSPGDPVVVERYGFELHGRICWVNSGIAGVRLDRRLTSKELAAQLTSLRGAEGSRGIPVGSKQPASLRRA